VDDGHGMAAVVGEDARQRPGDFSQERAVAPIALTTFVKGGTAGLRWTMGLVKRCPLRRAEPHGAARASTFSRPPRAWSHKYLACALVGGP
jgi:hypothetical protein